MNYRQTSPATYPSWLAYRKSLPDCQPASAVDFCAGFNAGMAEMEKFREGCKQARACLLNLMPDDISPLRQQMAKMVNELTKILDP